MSAGFPIDDTVGAWVSHGRFVIEPSSTGPLTSLTFAVKDVFDVAAHATGAGNPTWLATHAPPDRGSRLWGLRTSHSLISTEGLVPLHPSFDTPTWLTHDGSTFERVGEQLLPLVAAHTPRRLPRFDDAWAMADPVFQMPLQRVLDALANELAVTPQRLHASPDVTLETWRKNYATVGAHEGWQVHGAWIERHQPTFSPAILARWKAASDVCDDAASAARGVMASAHRHVRDLLGDNAVAVLPSAASR